MSTGEMQQTAVEFKGIIGVTGQIATGKSLCCEILTELLGAHTISLDRMVHELYDTDESLLRKVRLYFPDAFDGVKLNRRALAAIVFSQPNLRRKLERLVMPVLHKKLRQKLISLRAGGVGPVLIEAPLLLEYNFDRYCDLVVLLVASRDRQIERAVARGSISEAEVLLRRSVQTPTHRARHFAEAVVSNNRDKDQLRSKLARIFA